MRGSSVHFKRIASALHAVSHASREVPPEYLLPEGMSLGTHVVIDDHGQVQKLLEHKMHLASRQAKAVKDYSPMWEGVINLPEPSSDLPPARQIEIVKAWCVEYEKITGHKVIRADVHLDEGFVDEAGEPNFNAHAHVMCDRTDDKGRVKKLTSTVLREVQTMTANVTTLQRGLDAKKTRRKHINHHNFRFDAEKTRLGLDSEKAKTELLNGLVDSQNVKTQQTESEVVDLKAQIAQLKAEYAADRAALKASGEATQKKYQDLKVKYEAKDKTFVEMLHKAVRFERERNALAQENKTLKAENAELKANRKKELAPPAFAVLIIENTSTAAFEDLGRNEEAAQIVRRAAATIEQGWNGKPFDLRDTNGNMVGTFIGAATLPKKPPEGGIQLVMPWSVDWVGTLRYVATKLREMVAPKVVRFKDPTGDAIAELTVTPPLHPTPEHQPAQPDDEPDNDGPRP